MKVKIQTNYYRSYGEKLILDEINKNNKFSMTIIEEWDKTSFDLVIKKADKLLYKAKREGKNKIVNR